MRLWGHKANGAGVYAVALVSQAERVVSAHPGAVFQVADNLHLVQPCRFHALEGDGHVRLVQIHGIFTAASLEGISRAAGQLVRALVGRGEEAALCAE